MTPVAVAPLNVGLIEDPDVVQKLQSILMLRMAIDQLRGPLAKLESEVAQSLGVGIHIFKEGMLEVIVGRNANNEDTILHADFRDAISSSEVH